MGSALRRNWPEYLIEAGLLAAFMLSALSFATLLEHPDSPVRAALPDALVRRAWMGLAMGATAVALVYSPFGQRSGAHFNPAFTLTYLRLGKVRRADAAGYVAAHFAGAIAGVALAALLLGPRVAHPAVRFAATVPGPAGPLAAFAAEAAISFGLMSLVLRSTAHPRLAPCTGLLAGALVATWITLEAPLSGTSMNPARSLGSALASGVFEALWIYFAAPLLGMLAAAELYVRRRGPAAVACAKLHHAARRRCIHCGLPAAAA